VVSAKILYFPGCEMSQVEVEEDDFDTVRAAIEQEVENSAHALGQCATEVEWLAEVNALVERLLEAALRKSPDG
jgi:hypothetical protein